MLLVTVLLTALIILGVLLQTLFWGEDRFLLQTSSIMNEAQCEEMRKKILEQFLKDERAFAEQLISKSEWLRRQNFLQARYLDIVRRLDYLRATSKTPNAKKAAPLGAPQLSSLALWLVVFCGGALLWNEKSFSAPKLPAIYLSARHIVILQGSNDFIWGTYYFAVHNSYQVATKFEVPITLPEEITDFEPGEGVTKQDFHMLDNGKIVVKKDFPPGLTLAAVGFKIPLRASEPVLTFKPETEFGEFSVVTAVNSGLTLNSSERFRPGIPQMLEGGGWQGIISNAPLAKGEKFVITVSGFPTNYRLWMWVIALTLGSILVICFAVFGMRRRKEDYV